MIIFSFNRNCYDMMSNKTVILDALMNACECSHPCRASYGVLGTFSYALQYEWYIPHESEISDTRAGTKLHLIVNINILAILNMLKTKPKQISIHAL